MKSCELVVASGGEYGVFKNSNGIHTSANTVDVTRALFGGDIVVVMVIPKHLGDVH